MLILKVLQVLGEMYFIRQDDNIYGIARAMYLLHVPESPIHRQKNLKNPHKIQCTLLKVRVNFQLSECTINVANKRRHKRLQRW